MSIESEKAELQAKLAEAQVTLEKVSRRLQKLESVQDIDEPDPGSVIRFSRPLAGSTQKYTFVTVRIGSSWFTTGTDNALRLLGLSNKGSTWDQMLVAIGSAKSVIATGWMDPTIKPEYEYFRGYDTGKVFRANPATPNMVEVQNESGQTWRRSLNMTLTFLRSNPGSYRRLIHLHEEK